jgi:hypothetical protein
VTVVVDHVQGRIVWACRGKNAATLKALFDKLGSAARVFGWNRSLCAPDPPTKPL